ncbi:hypothetical protein KSS87_022456 [Heliosperma pusillum]|nr:hypothetical protein KSS87_022456 [Heliosperma pusillum]
MERNNVGVNGMEKGVEQGKNSGKKWDEIIIRVLVLLLTLVAAILVGIDKQTKIVAITISPDLPAFNVPVSAKSSYVSAFVYFVVANSISCAFTAFTLIATLARKGGRNSLLLFTTMLIDLMMLALLFSSVGAAGAVGVLGVKGNSHLRWNKVCDVYTKFCHHVEAAVALSFFAAAAYILLLLLEISKLQRSR